MVMNSSPEGFTGIERGLDNLQSGAGTRLSGDYSEQGTHGLSDTTLLANDSSFVVIGDLELEGGTLLVGFLSDDYVIRRIDNGFGDVFD
jgi:hypothetical protein